MMVSLIYRRPHWPLLLLLVLLSWAIASLLTVAGIYIVFCRSQSQKVKFHNNGRIHTWIHKDTHPHDCGGQFTVMDGQVMLIAGCLGNGMLFSLLLVYLVLEKRLAKPRRTQEQPPAYETLIKEETPPPSYSQLDLTTSSSHPPPTYSLSPLSLTTHQLTVV